MGLAGAWHAVTRACDRDAVNELPFITVADGIRSAIAHWSESRKLISKSC